MTPTTPTLTTDGCIREYMQGLGFIPNHPADNKTNKHTYTLTRGRAYVRVFWYNQTLWYWTSLPLPCFGRYGMRSAPTIQDIARIVMAILRNFDRVAGKTDSKKLAKIV